MGDYGTVALSFDRDIVFDPEIVKDFMPDYVEPVIRVEPT